MDSRGIIFSIDAALALIPLFILLAAVSNLGGANLIYSSDQVRINNDAQDTLETMANYKPNDNGFTVLQNITDILIRNNNSAEGIALSGGVASSYLNKILGSSKYTLTEINQLEGEIIASNAEMENSNNIAVGVRNYGDYTFRLCIWD